jgi:hypothetical protein
MELAFVILIVVLIFAALVVMGKSKGAPTPESMSDAALYSRHHSEIAWMNRYIQLSYTDQCKPELKKMYEEKKVYVDHLTQEIARRYKAHDPSHGLTATANEMAPILERAKELMGEGKSEAEAHGLAIQEWGSKTK